MHGEILVIQRGAESARDDEIFLSLTYRDTKGYADLVRYLSAVLNLCWRGERWLRAPWSARRRFPIPPLVK